MIEEKNLIIEQEKKINDIQNSYASKDYVLNAIKLFNPAKSCTGTGDSCTISFKYNSDVALCLVGTRTGGEAGVNYNIGIYYVGWHSPDGTNIVANKAIIHNTNGLKIIRAYYNEVTFTINYPTNIEVTCYEF